MAKQVVVTLTVDQCIAHKNWAYGRGTGCSFESALVSAIRDARKHPNFHGKRIQSGKITFAVSQIENKKGENTNDN